MVSIFRLFAILAANRFCYTDYNDRDPGAIAAAGASTRA